MRAALSPRKSPAREVGAAFDIHAVIHGCSNIPFSTARVFCKWKCPSLSLDGTTDEVEITSSHDVVWEATVVIPGCAMKVDPCTNMLKASYLRISVRQVNRSVMKGFIRLGVVVINLADYGGTVEVGET